MIEQLIREERKTPVAGKSDVLAVGGGQAGVSAAALALDQGKESLRELDIAPLQRALEETGVTIHMEERFLHGVSEKKFNHSPRESGMSGIKLDTLAY